MKSLWNLCKFLKPYWKLVVIAPFLMALEVAMDLLQPYFMSKIVDVGIAQKDTNVIITTGLIMIGLALLGAFGGIANGYFAARVAFSAGADLRTALYRKVQTLSFRNLDTFKTSHLITRLTNDITQYQNVLRITLRILVRTPLLFLGSIILAYITSPKLSLIFVFMLPILTLALLYITKKTPVMFQEVQKKLDQINEVMQENLAGIRVVKAFNRGNYERVRFGESNDDLMQTTINAIKMVAIIHPIFMLTINIAIAAAVYFGGLQVTAGDLTTGSLIAFYNYLLRAMFSLIMMTMILTNVIRSAASAQRIEEVLLTEPTIKNADKPLLSNSLQGYVRFENITFQYDNDSDPVLKNISFEARPGQMIAILGATGSGKSSLINLIPRFYEASEGTVYIDNSDVRVIDLVTLRRSIGVALQESVLFSGTIRDNIRYGNPEANDEEVIAAAKAAQTHDFIMAMENGYDTNVEQRGVNLSGGQKQRLAIARAILLQPSILILDDSTSAVDVETETKIQIALDEIMKNRTSFVIAQRISTVLNADKILVLNDGEIVAEGDHYRLMKTSPIYQEIFESQLGKGVLNNVSAI